MNIEKIKTILEERGFKYNKNLSEDLGCEDRTILYEKGREIVDIYIVSNKIVDVFISNMYYDFLTDYNDRSGINLGYSGKHRLSEELFIYCLDIQENPGIYERGLCKLYLEFSEWRDKELNPVLDYFNLKQEDSSVSSKDVDGFYLNLKKYIFCGREEDNLYVLVEIDEITLKIKVEICEEDYSFLFKESSDVIFCTIDNICESKGLKSLSKL